jgi:phosphodiesterase/alkaline phosphatase D-like protein
MRLAGGLCAATLWGCAATAPSGPVLFPHGVASGDMTSEAAILWTRTDGPARVVAEVSLTPGFEDPRVVGEVATAADWDFAAKVAALRLAPGTRYYYRFRGGGNASAVGSFRTAYATHMRAPVTLGFTGDADWRWKPYPILESLAAERLDFFVFLGDLVYEWADPKGAAVVEGLAGYRAKYRENREPHPASDSGMVPMRALHSSFGHYAVFDNHELGRGNDPAGPPYPDGGARIGSGFVNKTGGFRERIRAFREHQPVSEARLEATGDARTDGTSRFYRAVSWGADVELIVLDGRSYRDAGLGSSEAPGALSCERTMLGPVQARWLERSLLAAERRGATWKVVVTPSPMQRMGGKSQVGADLDSDKSWAGGYRCERDRLLAFIDANAIDNVVFLTTDFHYTVVNNLDYHVVPGDERSPRRPARNAFEVMTGPLGARAGTPPFGRSMGLAGLSRRDADRKAAAILNGDAPDAEGLVAGLAQAGLDRLGLERGFPGLDEASIRTAGGAAGVAEPLAFVSFASFAYAVLTFDHAKVRVRVKTMANVPDPASLDDPAQLRQYEERRAEETLEFVVKASGVRRQESGSR